MSHRSILRSTTFSTILGILLLLPVAGRAAPGVPSPDGVWTEVGSGGGPGGIRTDGVRQAPVFALQPAALEAVLDAAPLERTPDAAVRSVVLTLPMPDGSYERVRIENSPVMEAALAAARPDIATFRGHGVDDPTLTARFDRTPLGFHAIVLSPAGTVFITPESRGADDRYVSYRMSDAQSAAFQCLVTDVLPKGLRPSLHAAPSGDQLRSFRLAVAATGEFTQFFGSEAAALAGIVTVVNNVNAVYNLEVAVHFNLIADNADIIYDDPGADPFPLSDKNAEVQAEIDATIGDGDYDIGHLFHVEGSDISGNAGCIGCICTSGSKGSGWSQGPDPTNADFTFVVCHEMGHQVGGRHTFNGTGCSASQYTASSSYEPGSGTTIMSYSSVCGSDNVIGGLPGDLYFHAASRGFITTVIGAAGCVSSAATGNAIPTVSAGGDYTIPRGTPFVLTASGNDGDGDPLTYCWEQFDLGGVAQPLTTADDGVIPLFRSFPPVADASRTFPRYADLLSGNLFPGTLGEQLPGVDRVLNFKVTARDNQPGGGGAVDDEMIVTVSGAPFQVTEPDGGETLVGGCETTVTWDVGGGGVAPTIDILYSTDGGATFPTTLLAGTANDGSAAVTIPCGATTQGRIMIRSVGNIFFNISGLFAVSADGPAIVCDIVGGEVDDDCEFLATFTGTVTDDCSVDDGDVDIVLSLPLGGATLGTPTVNKVQVDGATVTVSGSVLVSDLTGGPVTVRLSIGAEDNCGNTGTCQSDAQVADTTPPTISVTLNRYALWPPNHKMSEITAMVVAEDNCDPMVAFELTSITSDEPDNGLGDGDTANDIQGALYGAPDLSFFLRSERSGTMDGRVYTIIYTAEDNAGNTATDTVTVRVPHSGNQLATNGLESGAPVLGALTGAFGLVIYGSPSVDVTLVDAAEACLGNHVGAIRPSDTRVGDIDGDAIDDLALVYDKKTAGALKTRSTKLYPVGFHCTIGGADYVTDNVFDLGLAVPAVAVGDVPSGDDDLRAVDGSVTGPTGIAVAGTRQLTLPAGGHVRIDVFNVQGRLIARLVDRSMGPGTIELDWSGKDDAGSPVPSGIYFYRIDAPGVNEVRKVHIVR
jgi:hypothetical protein